MSSIHTTMFKINFYNNKKNSCMHKMKTVTQKKVYRIKKKILPISIRHPLTKYRIENGTDNRTKVFNPGNWNRKIFICEYICGYHLSKYMYVNSLEGDLYFLISKSVPGVLFYNLAPGIFVKLKVYRNKCMAVPKKILPIFAHTGLQRDPTLFVKWERGTQDK